MATAHIEEYAELAKDSEGNLIPVGQQPAITTQAVTYTSSNASSALDKRTRFVRIIADADAYYSFGVSPSATANSPFIPADSAEYFGIQETNAGTIQIAFYDGTT